MDIILCRATVDATSPAGEEKIMKNRIEKALAQWGYTLSRFAYGDTRRIGPSDMYRWYIADDRGLLLHSFVTLAHVANWIDEH